MANRNFAALIERGAGKNGLAFSNRGWVLGQQGQYERSIADLDNAIKLMPNLAKANNRGFALGQIAQSDRAIAEPDTAIRLDAKDPQAWRNRARPDLLQQRWRYRKQGREGEGDRRL